MFYIYIYIFIAEGFGEYFLHVCFENRWEREESRTNSTRHLTMTDKDISSAIQGIVLLEMT